LNQFWEGGEEMNKKILGVTISILTMAMLVAPLVGVAYAGKGEEKLDFVLYMVGATAGPPDKIWTTNGGIMQIKGYHWGITGDYYIEVDGTKYYPTGYSSSLIITINTKTGASIVHVKESIIFDDGTIEITVIDITFPPEPTEGSFTGIGTGSLAGVKVQGTCDGHDTTTIIRTGTIMGWPD
jgi:hypothetical protein